MPDLDSEALDFRAASESFASIRKIGRRDLLTDYQGRKVPTVGGVLLFGSDRAYHFLDAWIQVALSIATESGPRRERWSLPPVSVREAVINAVAHADYAQRGAPLRIAIFDDRLTARIVATARGSGSERVEL